MHFIGDTTCLAVLKPTILAVNIIKKCYLLLVSNHVRRRCRLMLRYIHCQHQERSNAKTIKFCSIIAEENTRNRVGADEVRDKSMSHCRSRLIG